jgi:hypothetical protein
MRLECRHDGLERSVGKDIMNAKLDDAWRLLRGRRKGRAEIQVVGQDDKPVVSGQVRISWSILDPPSKM